MGFYFNGTDTREVVSRNFNSIRKLFGLNSQKLAELMEPLARIPYQKVRRLAAGERDITAEELNALYELLAVPPATFTFPGLCRTSSPPRSEFRYTRRTYPKTPSLTI